MKKYIMIPFLLLGLSIQAQEQLSLQQCRDLALQNSQQVEIAQAQMNAAEAQKNAARAMYLPNVSASLTGIYRHEEVSQELYMPTYAFNPLTGQLEPNVAMHPLTGQPILDDAGNPVFNMYAYMPLELSMKGAYMAGVTVEQPLYAGGQIYQGNQMAKLGVQMANNNIELQQQNVILDVDQAYWMYVAVAEKVKLANEAVKTLEELLTLVQNNVDAGMIHKNELLKVQVQLNQAKLDQQKAKSGLELSRMALCRMIGKPFDTAVIPNDTLIQVSDSLLLTMGSESYTSRPEYRLLQQQILLQEKQVKLTRGQFLPSAGVQLGYSSVGGIELSGEEITNSGTMVMASVSVPIFHFGEGHYKVKAEQQKLMQRQLELEQNSELMQLQLEKTKFDVKDARLRVQMAEEALVQADENLKVNQDFYTYGKALLTDVLMAQTQWQQAYSELIDAKTDYKIKETMYLKASGQMKI
jgi:outer membrane protein TolC